MTEKGELESREASGRSNFILRMVRVDLRILTFEQRPEGNEGASHMNILKKSVLGESQ